MSTPHPYTILFARGTLARLALWSTLRLAVHASWGGPASAEKQRWLASVLVDQFEPFLVPPVSSTTLATTSTSTSTLTAPPDDVYVEDLLLQIMADEFDVVLEDGSAAAVAKDLVKLFEKVSTGHESFVKELEEQAETIKGKMPKYEIGVGSGSESGSEDEWEDEEEDEGESAPQLIHHSEPEIDEDGFTIVKKKGRR